MLTKAKMDAIAARNKKRSAPNSGYQDWQDTKDITALLSALREARLQYEIMDSAATKALNERDEAREEVARLRAFNRAERLERQEAGIAPEGDDEQGE